MNDQDENLNNPEENPARTGGYGMIIIGWGLVIALLTFMFGGILDSRTNPNRLAALQKQEGKLALSANHLGHYLAEGRINGAVVTFLLDTGATVVAVPESVIDHAGLSKGAPITIETAAGKQVAYQTHIRRLELGDFVFSDLDAVIIPSQEDIVLLGMNALGELQLTQKDGELTLRHPNIN